MSFLDRLVRTAVTILPLITLGFTTAEAQIQAQTPPWPSRSVRLIVPYTTGGGADVIARIISSQLAEMWGHPIVVENRSGAGGNIASEAVAQSAADGYTIYLAGEFISTAKFIYPQLKYDALRDFAPVTLAVKYPVAIVVPNRSPARSIRDFIAQARQRAGKMTYASPGLGSAPHLIGELFKRVTEVDITHVPYRGAAPALQDLLPGRTDSFFTNIAPVAGFIRDVRLRALAVTSGARAPIAPEVPTLVESGFPELDASGWYAFLVPARTPTSVIEKLHADIAEVLTRASVRRKLEGLGLFIVGSTPAELGTFLQSETDRWGPLISSAGIKLE